MSKVKFKLNKNGVKQLLKSEGVASACEKEARRVQKAAGPGYEVGRRNYPERTGFAIYPSTPEANADNYKNNTLEKVLRR